MLRGHELIVQLCKKDCLLERIQLSSKVLTEVKLVSAKEAKEIILLERVDLEHVEGHRQDSQQRL